jgi:hypothetical protein
VFNDVRVLHEDGREQDSCYPPYLKNKLTLLDFVANNFINCSSLTFRHWLIDRFPDWFLQLSYYDWALHILHLEHGFARYISEPLSTYRIHGTAAWQRATTDYRVKQTIATLRAMNEHLDYKYDSILRLNERYWQLQRTEELLHAENAAQRRENAELHRALHDLRRNHVEFAASKAFRVAHLLSRLKARSLRWLRGRAA